jgi:hypothetical protein
LAALAALAALAVLAVFMFLNLYLVENNKIAKNSITMKAREK